MENNLLYSRNVLEFVTVVAETCLFLENTAEQDRDEFLNKAVKILSLLYLKTSTLPATEQLTDEEPEYFVSETDYEQIRASIALLMGTADDYLEVFTQGIEYSEEGVLASISEDLADVYQDLKNFVSAYQIDNEEVMNDALYYCSVSFREFWGQKLLNCLRALHATLYSGNNEDEDSTEDTHEDSTKNRMLKHLQSDWDDEILNALN
jgi:hypothetical protein